VGIRKEVLQMAKEDNKAVVRRYFEVLDAGNTGAVDALFSKDCRIYRPEQPEPLVGTDLVRLIVLGAHQLYSEFKTTIHDMIQEGECVAVRLTHNAVYRDKWTTRIGTFDCVGKPTKWDAMAMFVLRGGKIIEEHVMRDELGMLLSVGALQRRS
jgi:ketosteroid isomerase-like protein